MGAKRPPEEGMINGVGERSEPTKVRARAPTPARSTPSRIRGRASTPLFSSPFSIVREPSISERLAQDLPGFCDGPKRPAGAFVKGVWGCAPPPRSLRPAMKVAKPHRARAVRESACDLGDRVGGRSRGRAQARKIWTPPSSTSSSKSAGFSSVDMSNESELNFSRKSLRYRAALCS